MAFENIRVFSRKNVHYLFMVFASILIGLTRIYSFLLFHSIIEFVSIAVSIAIFFIFWNSKEVIDNNFFVFIGTSFIFIAALDLVHTLSYSGMNIFIGYTADLATQLWIAARFFQASTLLVGFFFINRKIKTVTAFFIFLSLAVVSFVLIFTGSTLPLYIEGEGLTLTKKIIEYVISAILVASAIFLYIKREFFDNTIFKLIFAALIFTVISELSFTFYLDVYGVMNMTGHFFKLFSVYFFYRAFVTKGLSQPINLLFKNLQDVQFQRMNSLIENLPEGIVFLDNENTIILMNYAAEEMLPKITNKQKQKKITKLDDYPLTHYLGSTEAGIPYHTITINKPKKAIFEVHGTSMKDKTGTNFHILNLRDVTIENVIRTRVESQERLASLGEMARGISHDFQNILNTIAGASELAEAMSEDVEQRKLISLIRMQSIKGSEFINQILAFSRNAEVSPTTIALKPLIENTIQLIRTAIPTSINLKLDLKELDIVITKVQLEQVLMNLIMNAKDSISKSGTISISVAEVDSTHVRDFEESRIKEGKYVRIRVSDDGEGMSNDTVSKIFEPFFTTKPVGKGSGLGLSQVYGITRQHHGYICVQSEINKGTEINLFFPSKKENKIK